MRYAGANVVSITEENRAKVAERIRQKGIDRDLLKKPIDKLQEDMAFGQTENKYAVDPAPVSISSATPTDSWVTKSGDVAVSEARTLEEERRQQLEQEKYAEAMAQTREEARYPAFSEIRPDVLPPDARKYKDRNVGVNDFDTVLNDGFGLSIKRANLFEQLFHDKLESGATVQGAYFTQRGNVLKDREPEQGGVAAAAEQEQWMTAVDNALGVQTSFADALNETVYKATGKENVTGDLTLTGILFDPRGFNASVRNEAGAMQADPIFLTIMGLATEKFIHGAQFQTTTEINRNKEIEEEADPTREGPDVKLTDEGGMLRTVGNGQLGREIYRAWKREQNLMQGRPTDEYTERDVTNDQFEIIGATAKEMYHSANPHMYERLDNGVGSFDKDPANKHDVVEYRLTDTGIKLLKAAEQSAPDAFRNYEIRPRNEPANVMQETEASKYLKTKTTSIVDRRIARIEEARLNMGSVPHRVDPLRRKIVTQLAMNILAQIKGTGAIPQAGDVFKIGPSQFNEFKRELAKKEHEGSAEGYSPSYEMEKQTTKFLEFLNTMARYSNKANYLDFVLQELTMRMHAGQTRFNPQLQPWVRFVTGGMTPSTVNPRAGSDETYMFKELMAVHFLGKPAKRALPETRIKMFNDEWNSPGHGKFGSIISAGKGIADSLITTDQDSQYTKSLSDIQLVVNQDQAGQQDISIPPDLQNIPPLNVEPGLMKEAMKEGIDGLHLIEAAHELHQFKKAFDNNTVFHSNIGVEVDGITHGPASFAATLGSVKAAYRTGVLRKEGATQSLDSFSIGEMFREAQGIEEDFTDDEIAGDFRDAMAEFMFQNGEVYAGNFARQHKEFDLAPQLYGILKLAIKDRDNFLKKPPMTLSYGQMLANLTDTIKNAVMVGDQANAIQQIINEPNFNAAMRKKIGNRQTDVQDEVVSFLHDTLADAIDTQIHPGIQEVGQALRANNVVAMLTNQVMEVKNALGIKTYIGARTSTQKDEKGNIQIVLPSGGKVGGVYLYTSTPSGSALRDGRPGGWGRGRIIPAIIQAIDGAWMNKMFTDSWHGGAGGLKRTYMLPIMDAVKTDLKGARRVREHANKNWWDSIKDYNYFDSLMNDWTPKTINSFREKLKDLGDTPIEISLDNEYRGFWWLMHTTDTDTKYARDNGLQYGDLGLQNLANTLADTGEFDPRMLKQSVREYKSSVKRQAMAKAEAIFPKIAERISNKRTKGISTVPANSLLQFFDVIIDKGLNLTNRNEKVSTKYTNAQKKYHEEVRRKNQRKFQVDIG